MYIGGAAFTGRSKVKLAPNRPRCTPGPPRTTLDTPGRRSPRKISFGARLGIQTPSGSSGRRLKSHSLLPFFRRQSHERPLGRTGVRPNGPKGLLCRFRGVGAREADFSEFGNLRKISDFRRGRPAGACAEPGPPGRNLHTLRAVRRSALGAQRRVPAARLAEPAGGGGVEAWRYNGGEVGLVVKGVA